MTEVVVVMMVVVMLLLLCAALSAKMHAGSSAPDDAILFGAQFSCIRVVRSCIAF